MKFSPWIIGSTLAVFALPAALPSTQVSWLEDTQLISKAHADVYHSVNAGDTLASVSARYGVSTDVLRAANGLPNTHDGANLPQMLLRVPDKKNAPVVSASASTLPSLPNLKEVPTMQASNGFGSATRSVVYVVQAGETVESIAARYTQGGYPVTASAIRSKNNGLEQPSVGYRLLIPLQSVSYRAPQVRTVSTATTNPSGQTETAREIVSAPPVYQAPGSSASSSNRRLDGARVLGSGEEAPVTGTSTASRAAAPVSGPTARVAVISKSGARIRRLPDASATTLYQSAKGTELAVTQQQNGWSAILMSDRSTGWIPSHYLKFTGASVDISTQVLTNVRAAPRRYASRGATSSRSGYAVRGNFSSDNPMVAQALTWMGTRYVYGGTTRRGIDCSALVQNSFRACGYRLPRTAAEQARVGTPIDVANLQAGDRLYFSASGRRIDHTGLYMGNGLFVHASGTGRSVIVSNLFDRRNWNIYVGARR